MNIPPYFYSQEKSMKNTVVYIDTDKRKYPLVFNLNVMEEIQEQYGSLDEWGKVTQGNGEPQVKDLKNGIMAMINEAIDIEEYDVDFLADMVMKGQIQDGKSQVAILMVKQLKDAGQLPTG